MDDQPVVWRPTAPVDHLRGISDMPASLVDYRRNRLIQLEGQPAKSLYHVVDGWVAGSAILSSGSRQITTLYLPGDLIGIDDLFKAETSETLSAISKTTLRRIDIEHVRDAIVTGSALALSILQISVKKTAAVKSQLTSIGRTAATPRLAAFLANLAVRLGCPTHGTNFTIDFPLTQDDLGDAIGLTAVHVNRTLKRLVTDGLITRNNSYVTIVDLDRLRLASDLPRQRNAE